MRLFILNGPNLNLLGQREPEIYGHSTLSEIVEDIRSSFQEHRIDHSQSNSEGTLIDELQEKGYSHDGILFNPAAFTHTSVALADTIRAIPAPVVEVHLSDPEQREPYRKVNFLREYCVHSVAGKGISSYTEGLEWLIDFLGREEVQD